MSSTSVPLQNPEPFVLDSWPFVEQTLRGVSIPRMTELLDAAARGRVRLLMSEMNLGELYYLVAKQRDEAQAQAVTTVVRGLPIEIVPILSTDLWEAVRWKSKAKLSYADSFCAALAVRYNAQIVTGDPDFLPLQRLALIDVDWVGR